MIIALSATMQLDPLKVHDCKELFKENGVIHDTRLFTHLKDQLYYRSWLYLWLELRSTVKNRRIMK